jgi:cytochrome P450
VTDVIVYAARVIREKYSPRWRWLARWRNDGRKSLQDIRSRSVRLLTPAYNKRLNALNNGGNVSNFNDCLYWSLSRGPGDESIDQLVEQQLFLAMASIHTNATLVTLVLFDLLAYPEYYSDILEEILQVSAENNGHWTPQSVDEMKKLDSFMKESLRLNPMIAREFIFVTQSTILTIKVSDKLI